MRPIDDKSIALPPGLDWRHWVECWERMQERYLVRELGRQDDGSPQGTE